MNALITGASAGIGRHLAAQFARHGFDVILAARREGALQTLAAEITAAGGRARVIPADLERADGAALLYDHLQQTGVGVDVLVNNAGFGLQGPFAELPLERQVAMIQLNVTSLTSLTRLMLPSMLARNRGGVLNVASTAAFQPGPLMAVYYASKAFVLSLTEAVAEEVAGTALKVSCLAPGPTRTEFAERASMTGVRLFKGPVMTAEDVARIGFDGWNAGKRLVIPGLRNQLGAVLVKLSPRSIVPPLIKRLNTIE